MKFEAEVLVKLKEGIRDPQGSAVDTVLKRTGLEDSSHVRTAKHFTLNVSGKTENEAKEKLSDICSEVLSNPVLESWELKRFERK